MTQPDVTQKCPYFPHLGPIGCLPAPNIFPLAKETFAKGKMFWNLKIKMTRYDKCSDDKNRKQVECVFLFGGIYVCEFVFATPSGQTKMIET